MAKRLPWVAGFIILSVAILFLLFSSRMSLRILRYLYPIRYEQEISESAKEYRIDPFLIASVIRVESGFDPNALSRKGATGLMQIMPSTGRWISSVLKVDGYNDRMLLNPTLNIRFGSWYIRELNREFGSQVHALAAYNAGRGKVSEWKRSGLWNQQGNALERVPYLETRVYIRRVLNAVSLYKRIYRNRWPGRD